MENKPMVARFMVYRVGSFVVKERVLCFGEYSFSTLDRENQQMTNTWPYEDVDGANALEGETDFVIHTPRHRIKKTVYRSQFRMDVLVCLLRLRSHHYAKMPNYSTPVGLQTHIFEGRKCYWSGMESPFVVEVRPDGIYQRDTEGDVMSCISYTSLVSMDVIGDDREAIVLNHADNSSLFFVPRRTELALAIERVMKAYGMQINKYGEKTMEMALKDGGFAATTMRTAVSFEYQVSKVSTSKESSGGAPRTLSVSEMYVTEYTDAHMVISCRPLTRVYSLIIYQDMVQTFRVVYVDEVSRTYNSYQREKIVCELLASCHALGNLQVGVEMADIPEFMRMIPRELIREGSKIANAVPNVNLTDRELRAVQANILQSLAVHGGRKTARTQRQLPRGLDEEMHSLAVEFNVNTPTYGVIAQPSKSFEKVLYILARELRDIVARHGANHDFVITYLQSLYRLMLAPAAINEFIKILTEREEEYIGTICKILDRKNSVATYWIFMVLSRLMESKEHKLQCRQLMLSNRVFLTTLLSLLDEDIRVRLFLSDLPTMKLCQLILLLVEDNDEKQPELVETLHQHLATKYRMLLRVLFSFPGLATVEACVGILSKMSKSVSCLQLGNVGLPVRSNGGKIQQALSFGPGSHRQAVAPQSNRPPTFSSRRNTYAANRSNTFSSSASSSGGLSGAPASVLVVQNPAVLLRQYRQFFEAAWGSLQTRLDQYDDPKCLRLRYRCRNTFLQELMSYLAGNFEEFKRVYKVDCYQFSGFIGTADGQRERTRFYLTPRGLISVRTASRHTQEFEYRSIKEIIEATTILDAFILIVKGKLKFIYSDESVKIVEKMKTLAGVVGIHLRVRTQEKLPKPPVEKPLDLSKFQSNDLFDVQRLTGRLGSTNLRKRKVCFVDGTIEEFTNCSKKVYDLKMLRRVVVPGSGGDDAQAVVVLEFLDCSRVTYVPYDTEKFLAAVYDGYRCVDNYNVSLSREFSSLNPRMSTRMLLRDEHERFLYCNHDGLYIPAHATLEKEFEMMNGEGVSIASATNRVAFALENLNMNVETCDFTKQFMRGRLEKLSFSHLLGGINNMVSRTELCYAMRELTHNCLFLFGIARVFLQATYSDK
uniref:DnaJ homologue subfamily C GRV2/DNAJC13 N-terminal domain-containing protein n=1 Tax=Hyaloperonospora arabidopsidis (strain Emoy2) TaxID=559515 RepID=M4BAL4_HYAAE